MRSGAVGLPFDALADAQAQLEEEKAREAALKAASTAAVVVAAPTAVTAVQYRLLTGIEKEGRDKFVKKMLVLCFAGSGTIHFYHDRGDMVVAHAAIVFKWVCARACVLWIKKKTLRN